MTECGALNCEAGKKGMVASYPQTVSTSLSRSSTQTTSKRPRLLQQHAQTLSWIRDCPGDYAPMFRAKIHSAVPSTPYQNPSQAGNSISSAVLPPALDLAAGGLFPHSALLMHMAGWKGTVAWCSATVGVGALEGVVEGVMELGDTELSRVAVEIAEVTVLMATRIARREEGRVSLKTKYMV